MSSQDSEHELYLREHLPGIIERNAAAYHAVRTAMARRDASVPLRRDRVALRVLNELLAPTMSAQSLPANNAEGFARRARQRLDAIEGLLGWSFEGRRYLDIGCGHGANITEAGRRKAALACGIDSDARRHDAWLAGAPNTFGMRYILDDLHTHDFGDTTFDLITSYDSFEHFDDPPLVLERCAQITAPGGVLFIDFCPLFHSPMGSHRYRLMNVPYVQNLFDDDLVSELLYGTPERDPYVEMNRLRLAQFQSILAGAPGWEVAHYSHAANYDYAWLVAATGDAMAHLDDDDLYVAGVTCILRRTG